MKKRLENVERVNAKVLRITKELEAAGYVIHHTAWAGGYLHRKESSITAHSYESREFSGIAVEVPSFSSSRYHNRIYFVKNS